MDEGAIISSKLKDTNIQEMVDLPKHSDLKILLLTFHHSVLGYQNILEMLIILFDQMFNFSSSLKLSV